MNSLLYFLKRKWYMLCVTTGALRVPGAVAGSVRVL